MPHGKRGVLPHPPPRARCPHRVETAFFDQIFTLILLPSAGSTDARGYDIKDGLICPQDLTATVFRHIGIDLNSQWQSLQGTDPKLLFSTVGGSARRKSTLQPRRQSTAHRKSTIATECARTTTQK